MIRQHFAENGSIGNWELGGIETVEYPAWRLEFRLLHAPSCSCASDRSRVGVLGVLELKPPCAESSSPTAGTRIKMYRLKHERKRHIDYNQLLVGGLSMNATPLMWIVHLSLRAARR